MKGANDTKLHNKQIPRRRDDLIERELPEELILYDPENDRAFLLNRVAALIWDLCDGNNSVEMIADQIATMFTNPVKQIHDDVRSFIGKYLREGLLNDLKSKNSTKPRKNLLQ